MTDVMMTAIRFVIAAAKGSFIKNICRGQNALCIFISLKISFPSVGAIYMNPDIFALFLVVPEVNRFVILKLGKETPVFKLLLNNIKNLVAFR